MAKPETAKLARRFVHHAAVVLGAVALTALFFLVLPLIQAISKSPTADLTVRTVDAANLPPPPPPPPEEEPEDEPEEEEPPPELTEDAPPLDLSQLELALNAGSGGGWLGGDFGVKLDTIGADAGSEALFSLADLDQRPRPVYQPSPMLSEKVRKAAPGTVWVLFIVDQNGRVENPIVQKSTDPVLEAPALAAVKKWRFEPGMRSGTPVRFRMRVPITFPEG